jgi:PDZ domain-containing protein
LAWQAPPPQRSRRWLVATLVGLTIGGLLLASVTVSIPYYALAPGSARQVNDLIAGPPGKTFPPRGQVMMATVSLRPAHPIDVAQSWFDHDTTIVKEEEIVGSTPPKQLHQVNLEEMSESKRTAVVVAFRRLGYDVPARGQGALITAVVRGKGFPAEGKLQEGEVITEVDGQKVQFVDDAVKLLQQHQPGDTVRVTVMSTTNTTRIEQLAMARNDDGKAVLGVELQTYKLDYDLPFKIDIESGDIGGPSAGLAFTLGILDDLTPGELTGNRKVAATGTIGIDGKVGDVGGVPQKTAAVIRSGAKVFLVPPGEFKQAQKRAGKRLQVIAVATLEDALNALKKLGGNVEALAVRSGGSPG